MASIYFVFLFSAPALLPERCSPPPALSLLAEREARAGIEAAGRAGMRELLWRLHALMGDALAAKELSGEADASYNAARDLIRDITKEIEDPGMRNDYENDPTRQALLAAGEPSAISAAGAASRRALPCSILATTLSGTPASLSATSAAAHYERAADRAAAALAFDRAVPLPSAPGMPPPSIVPMRRLARNSRFRTSQ